MTEMTITKEILAWSFAMNVLINHSEKHPLTRQRNLRTMETADADDAIQLIQAKITELEKLQEGATQ